MLNSQRVFFTMFGVKSPWWLSRKRWHVDVKQKHHPKESIMFRSRDSPWDFPRFFVLVGNPVEGYWVAFSQWKLSNVQKARWMSRWVGGDYTIWLTSVRYSRLPVVLFWHIEYREYTNQLTMTRLLLPKIYHIYLFIESGHFFPHWAIQTVRLHLIKFSTVNIYITFTIWLWLT